MSRAAQIVSASGTGRGARGERSAKPATRGAGRVNSPASMTSLSGGAAVLRCFQDAAGEPGHPRRNHHRRSGWRTLPGLCQRRRPEGAGDARQGLIQPCKHLTPATWRAGRGAVGRARQLAAGYQPAVIKVLSYARGAARVTKTGQYVQREDVPLETHNGRMLTDREGVADEIKAWAPSFSKRAESQDVGAIRVTLHGLKDTAEGRETYEQAIAAGFAGHHYAYRLDATFSGDPEARLVVALAGPAKQRLRVRHERVGDGEHGFAQRRFDMASEARIKERIRAATAVSTHAIDVFPGMTNHGRSGVTYLLNKLVEHGAALDDKGKSIGNVADARIAAREWGPSLRSQSVRDTMHLMLSAKAGTDVEALTRAARAFLHDRFADHKFMFGVHVDREADGHIHAHAVIAVKSKSGQRIHPGPETFREWREAYAQHAQAEGLRIVATSAQGARVDAKLRAEG